jgi:addiction module HigA family antidote
MKTQALNGLPAIHPGEFLAEILEESALSQAEFARRIGVSPMRISHIIKGTRPVTVEMACLFGAAFGQTPHYWLNLQRDFDLKTVQIPAFDRIKQGLQAITHASTVAQA